MAEIRMFRAIRPCIEKVDKIAALPYDVYNRKEAKREVEKTPDSFLRIDRAETFFDETVDTYDLKVYQKAKEELQKSIQNGDFVQEKKPMYYLYALTMNGRTQHGFVACASIDDYENKIIKKHENTRADKELDRIHHVDECSMQTGPIFLAYRQTQRLKEMIQQIIHQQPLYQFISEDGIEHAVWSIDHEDICEEIHSQFEQMKAIYIADGHHRCASAVKVGLERRKQHPDYTGNEEFNYFLSVIFPEEELYIMDYNRVLKDLNGKTAEEILHAVSENFEVEFLQNIDSIPAKPSQKGIILFLCENSWYQLKAKEQCFSNDPVENLDVSVLQNYILNPIFGIEDPKTDQRIDFVGGIRGLEELVHRCKTDCKAAFAMFPTDIQELFSVADANLLMPPKSTWFEPKLRSGIFLHEIER